MELRQLVYVTAGRDKLKLMIVVGFKGKHLLLADGRKRRLEKPKLKNIKHLKPLDMLLNETDCKSNRSLRIALSRLSTKQNDEF